MGLAWEGVDGPVEGGEGGAMIVEGDGGGEISVFECHVARGVLELLSMGCRRKFGGFPREPLVAIVQY